MQSASSSGDQRLSHEVDRLDCLAEAWALPCSATAGLRFRAKVTGLADRGLAACFRPPHRQVFGGVRTVRFCEVLTPSTFTCEPDPCPIPYDKILAQQCRLGVSRFVYVYMYIHTYTYHVHLHLLTLTSTYTYTYTFTHTKYKEHIHIFIHIHIRTHMHAYIYVHVCSCSCIYVYMYIP